MKRKLGTASFQCFLHCNCTDKGGQRHIKSARIIEWLVDSAGLQASSEQSLPCCQRVYRQLADKSDLKTTLATIEDIFAEQDLYLEQFEPVSNILYHISTDICCLQVNMDIDIAQLDLNDEEDPQVRAVLGTVRADFDAAYKKLKKMRTVIV